MTRVSMAYRIFIVILGLAALYACFEIVRFSTMNVKVKSVEADFLVRGPENADLVIVEFLDFRCTYCKQLNPPIEDFLGIRPDVKYIARPYPVLGETSQKLARIAIAAGLQGAYWEFHDAFLSNPNEINDQYIRETANLYNVDYDRLIKDSEGDEVKAIVQDNIDDAESIGVYSTPSLFIGKVLIQRFEKIPTVTDLVRLVEDIE